MVRRRKSRKRSGRRKKKTHCTPYKRCKTGPTLKELKAIARAVGVKGYSKHTSRTVGSLKRKIVAAGGVVPPTTYRDPLKQRVTKRMHYNLERYQASGRQKGAFYNLVGAPCKWLPRDSLMDLAGRLGVDVKKYKKTKKTLCRVMTKAIRSGEIPNEFNANGLLDHFTRMHPQELAAVARRVAVGAPQAADVVAAAQAHDDEVRRLSRAVEELRDRLDRALRQMEEANE